MSTGTLSQRRATLFRLVALSLVAVVLLAAGAGCAKQQKSSQLYNCPMHPTYIKDRPGDCPICGMRLVPMKSGGTVAAQAGPKENAVPPGSGGASETGAVKYVCPMESDSDVVSDKPGKCPKCGMDLVAVTDTGASGNTPAGSKVASTSADPQGASGTDASKGGERRILFYRNPMNPEVTSPVPAKDEMGMDYVPVYEDQVQPETVAGHAAVPVTEEGIRLAGIRTAPAVRGAVQRTVRTVGVIAADERRVHQVSPRVTGWVTRLYASTTGQFVRKGDPILSVYSPELLSSQTEYLQAKRTADALAASGMPEVRQGAADILEASRRRLELFDVPASLVRELDRTGTPERDVTLLAPVSGYVTVKSVVQGMQIQAGTELYTVTDLSEVWIDASLYQSEAPFVRVGQLATITLPNDPSAQMTGRVDFIYPELDPGSRTLRARFATANPGNALKPGMYANVELQIESGDGIVVPDNAVMDTGERQLVFVRTAADQFTPREVRVGLKGNGSALIVSGLREGEEVATRANFLLDSESRIRAAFAGAAGAAAAGDAGAGTAGTGSAQ